MKYVLFASTGVTVFAKDVTPLQTNEYRNILLYIAGEFWLMVFDQQEHDSCLPWCTKTKRNKTAPPVVRRLRELQYLTMQLASPPPVGPMVPDPPSCAI
jgi:hypothetical protein